MSKELYVTDQYGEIIDKIEANDKYVKISEGDKVVRKGVLQYLNDTADIKYRFVKVNSKAYWKVANKYPIFNKLLDHLGYMDGIICYSNGKKIQIKDIASVCSVSESTAKRQMSGLIKEDVIHKVKNKKQKKTYLMINPWIAMRGRKIYLSLYDEFKLSHWKNEVEEWEK